MATEQIKNCFFNYVETMQTESPQLSSELEPQATQIVDSIISIAMRQTFTSLALILILGFITSIFLPKKNNPN